MKPAPEEAQAAALARCRELIAAMTDAVTRGALLELLEGGDVNAQDWQGECALHMAGSGELLSALLAAGADPNVEDDCGQTPLETHFGDRRLARLLLEAGASPDRGDGYSTLLHEACREDDVEMVRLLLAHGAQPGQKAIDEETPLFYARSAEVAEALLAAGADPNAVSIDDYRPLHRANAAVTRVLLAHGAEVHHRQLFGLTALALAEDEEKVRLLRAAGARLAWQDVEHAVSFLFRSGNSPALEQWLRLRGGSLADVPDALARQQEQALARTRRKG